MELEISNLRGISTNMLIFMCNIFGVEDICSLSKPRTIQIHPYSVVKRQLYPLTLSLRRLPNLSFEVILNKLSYNISKENFIKLYRLSIMNKCIRVTDYVWFNELLIIIDIYGIDIDLYDDILYIFNFYIIQDDKLIYNLMYKFLNKNYNIVLSLYNNIYRSSGKKDQLVWFLLQFLKTHQSLSSDLSTMF